MLTDDLIITEELCNCYQTDISFIESLGNSGLIEIVTIEEKKCVRTSQLGDLEKMIRLHQDLDINVEGVEAIFHLLQRMNDLRERITRLENRLHVYESSKGE